MLSEEGYISLAQAAARFPGHRGADRLHPATLTRWILKGARALDGRRVKLEADRVGSRWLTTEPALRRFADALGAAGAPAPQPRPDRPPEGQRPRRRRAPRDGRLRSPLPRGGAVPSRPFSGTTKKHDGRRG